MRLVCPQCQGDVERSAPRTRHAHGPQRYRHADDGTILCLVETNGEARPALPAVGWNS